MERKEIIMACRSSSRWEVKDISLTAGLFTGFVSSGEFWLSS